MIETLCWLFWKSTMTKMLSVGIWGVGIYCFYDDQMSNKRRP